MNIYWEHVMSVMNIIKIGKRKRIKLKIMTREEQINEKVHELGQICFPDECNIWARENYEAQKVEWACKQMVEWADEHPKKGMVSLNKVCDMLYAMLTTQDINDYDYVTSPAYDNVVDFVEDFRKSWEE